MSSGSGAAAEATRGAAITAAAASANVNPRVILRCSPPMPGALCLAADVFATQAVRGPIAALACASLAARERPMSKTIYDFTEKTITGEPKSLADYKGKALLIVNVASRCGLTPQYEGLEKLHDEYASRGLCVLG